MIHPIWIYALSLRREQTANAGYSFVSQTHLLGMRPLFQAITGPGRSGTRCPDLFTENSWVSRLTLPRYSLLRASWPTWTGTKNATRTYSKKKRAPSRR